MARVPIGERIRDQRRRHGLTQSELAARLDISPGYLSLIENNKRLIGGGLLKRCAEALDVEIDLLTAYQDARLAADLSELARSLDLSGLDERSAGRFVAHAPDWARAFVRIGRLLRDTTDRAMMLAERLKRDPELGDIVHEVLTQITSIRSFAEILSDYDNVSPAEQRRFATIMAAESDRLTASARAMTSLLQTDPGTIGATSPERDVDDFLIDHRNHFPAIETAADTLRSRLGGPGPDLAAAIAARLSAAHGVSVVAGDRPCGGSRHEGEVVIRPMQSEATKRFVLARALAARELTEPIADAIDDPRLSSEAARTRAGEALARYAAGAMLLPYAPMLEAAERERYDVDRLQHMFAASFEQIAHRLVTLRRPGAEGVAFAFMRVDPAGNISKRFDLPGFSIPRYGSACPLWIAYSAFAVPGRMLSQMLETTEGERFLLFTRQVTKAASEPGGVPPQFSVMLGCGARDAGRVVYGDAYAGGHASLITRGGFECRACRRDDCAHRAHEPFVEHPAEPARPGRDGAGLSASTTAARRGGDVAATDPAPTQPSAAD